MSRITMSIPANSMSNYPTRGNRTRQINRLEADRIRIQNLKRARDIYETKEALQRISPCSRDVAREVWLRLATSVKPEAIETPEVPSPTKFRYHVFLIKLQLIDYDFGFKSKQQEIFCNLKAIMNFCVLFESTQLYEHSSCWCVVHMKRNIQELFEEGELPD